MKTATQKTTSKQSEMYNYISSNESPKVFLTDYASYNDGTQFEFGHWVDLEYFDDVDDFWLYVKEHFKEADEISPLDNYGSIREEIMLTDYENFPEEYYSETASNMKELFSWVNANEEERDKIEIAKGKGVKDPEDLFVYPVDSHYRDDKENAVWEIYEEINGEINTSGYLRFDWESYERDHLTFHQCESGNCYYTLD